MSIIRACLIAAATVLCLSASAVAQQTGLTPQQQQQAAAQKAAAEKAKADAAAAAAGKAALDQKKAQDLAAMALQATADAKSKAEVTKAIAAQAVAEAKAMGQVGLAAATVQTVVQRMLGLSKALDDATAAVKAAGVQDAVLLKKQADTRAKFDALIKLLDSQIDEALGDMIAVTKLMDQTLDLLTQMQNATVAKQAFRG